MELMMIDSVIQEGRGKTKIKFTVEDEQTWEKLHEKYRNRRYTAYRTICGM